MSIKVDQRRTLFAELKGYCHMCGDDDYMEVTEWSNGEGYDVCINRKSDSEKFSLTYGEWELMQVLMNWKGE